MQPVKSWSMDVGGVSKPSARSEELLVVNDCWSLVSHVSFEVVALGSFPHAKVGGPTPVCIWAALNGLKKISVE